MQQNSNAASAYVITSGRSVGRVKNRKEREDRVHILLENPPRVFPKPFPDSRFQNSPNRS